MPRSNALVNKTAYLFHRTAPGGAISRQSTGSSHAGTSWSINVQALRTHRHQTRRLQLHSTPSNALYILKQQLSYRQQPASSVEPSAARHYTTSRGRPQSRPGPLGTAFLLFPAVAIGAGVLTGYISLSPFSTATKASSSSAAGMSSKLIPANPADVMVIRNITPNVVTFSVPFKRFGTIPVGGRGTVVKLTSGALAVFSPVAMTDDVKAKLAELGGTVKYIIAPDIEHHIFITEWHQAYPEAKIIGPEGLPEKRVKQSANDPKIGKEEFAVIFTAKDKLNIKVDEEFDRDFQYEYVDSHANKELVFLYKPERVMIEADLMFNLPADEQYSKCPESEKKVGFPGKLFVNMQTTQGEAKGMKRFLWYVLSARDRNGFNESVKRINDWDFDTLIPCHGETLVGNGKETFSRIFEWHLTGKK
ncbi:hypothetical protein KVR01_003303 [Diaporthe batatas]|uniref:uncharacterized protein n=1 Tax=Diaporthe batatas TaxID=748121 RepID=UPI001D036A68|nr:uncharacterized protein KVR01_003303 [Diaporthe batatas]KAG8167614.1 hypothetical protein KVR01_003303 [Diaporthe batatas]